MKRKKKQTPEQVLESLRKWIADNERNVSYVARQMGISYVTLWRWLEGFREPSAESVAAIAEWLEEN